MAKSRSTFAKIQRERAKQEKQAAKRDRRISGADEVDTDDEEALPALDPASIAAGLATLHEQYDNGELSLDEFEARRAELQSRLMVE